VGNGVRERPAHFSIYRGTSTFFVTRKSFSLWLSFRIRVAPRQTNRTRYSLGEFPGSVQIVGFGLLAPERPVPELEQPPSEGDHSSGWLRLRALAHRHGVSR